METKGASKVGPHEPWAHLKLMVQEREIQINACGSRAGEEQVPYVERILDQIKYGGLV
jgi:hypothetical protein